MNNNFINDRTSTRLKTGNTIITWAILFTLTLLIVIPVVAQEPDPGLYERLSKMKASMVQKKASIPQNIRYNDYDLVYQRMKWEIDPAVNYIKGAITSKIKLKNTEAGSVQFDLIQALTVDSVTCHDEKLDFTHQDDILEIAYNESFNLSGIDSMTVFYHGVPAGNGFGSFIRSIHNDIPVIWTLSEPYGARDWWPCKQSLSDKIDSIDVIVTSPEEYRTASNGILASETVHNGFRTMHWKHRFPIATYLVAIAVTNYSVYSDYVPLSDGGEIEILNYVYPESLNDARQKTPRTVEIMELYNELFGTYPFAAEKYGHAQFGWGGGMEHQTMGFMGSFSFGLVAHELSHQWFGDYITLGSWHDIWLNEGFATWATGLTYENIVGEDSWLSWRKQQISSITSKTDGSVYVADTTSISRIFNSRLSYSKGAYLLHMLRWVIGDEALFAALTNYLNDPEIANGFASQRKWVEHLEAVSDTSLTEFFNDWYYGEGYPIYSIHYSQDSGQLLQITLSQEQSYESVSFFEMPVQIRCLNQSGTDSVNFRLENTFNGQEFIVDPGFEVGSIKFDPDLWLISKTSEIHLDTNLNKDPQEITFFPNPAHNFITLNNTENQSVEKAEIISLSGKILKTIDTPGNKLFINFLYSGTYILKLKTHSGNIIGKFVKN